MSKVQLQLNPFGSGVNNCECLASYYVLTVSDEKRLTNGFRFLKELLLQHHNFKMNSVYNIFREKNINLSSVKTDAFVIKENMI